ncbi:APC family permease [Streptomyces sp. NPDC091280]|uniref:APC family permease n=1 Tax=Streptomyces sp. NPDC091280 TaxID=3365984 RepID=UPI0038103DCC
MARREQVPTVSGAKREAEVVEQPRRLQGSMGVGELAMSVLAFSAPLTTVAGFIPVLLMYGGKTGPAIYIVATVVLLAFCVGFTLMGRTVPNPGGFYAFVTQGLGRSAGLGGAFLATFGYFMIGFFAPPFFAITIQSYVEKNLHGPHIGWGWYALAIVAVTTALAYRRIDLSAKVLTAVMLLEVVVVVVFDVASFAHGAPSGTGGASLSLPWVTDPNIGLALLFVVGNFFGFEATVIFREEVKDPDRTIPRATYLSVVGIGVFYALAAWAYIAFTGADKAQSVATANLGGLFTDSMTALVGKTVVDVVTVLLMTSILASMLSIHNVAARYMHSLGTDGVVPKTLGKVHPRHGSPYVAASLIGALWAIGVVLFVALGSDPNVLYARASGIGSFAILLLLFAASVAVYFYFRRNPSTEPMWKTALAPLVSAAGIGVVAYLAVANYSDLLGGSGFVTSFFLFFTFALFLVGMVHARILRGRRPEVYQRIGRQEL